MLKTIQYCAIIFNEVITQYIQQRQIRALSCSYSETFVKLFTKEEFTKSCSYNKDRLYFSSVKGVFDTILNIMLVKYIEFIQGFITKNISTSEVILALIFVLFYSIISIPWNFFYDFVIEEKHGFNKKTVKIFFIDLLKQLALTTILGYIVSSVMFYFLKRMEKFEYSITAFLFVFQIFMLWIYPTFITPLFFKVKPLENGELKDKINAMAKKVNFNCDKIEVIDGSTRSGHSNAYFVGLGKIKRIVFFDTLLTQMADLEIVAILCHELGHWTFNHIIQRLAFSMLTVFGNMYIFRKFMHERKNKEPLNTTFFYFTNILSFLQFPLSYLTNAISRAHERQADEFAVTQGYGQELIEGLIKLSKQNLSLPVVDPIYSAIHFSHPHVLERIEFIEQAMKKTN